MPILVVAGGGLTRVFLRVGLEMGELPPLCWGIPLVLISPDGGIPLFSLQTTDKSFSQPRTTASSRTPTPLPAASMAVRRFP